MVKNSRKGMLFGAAGLIVGLAAGAAGMLSLRGGDGPYALSPPKTHAMGAAAPSTTAFIAAVAGNCDMAPILPDAGNGDGRATLQAKPGEATADEVGSLILSGKEAAASGRQRDAEVLFLNACRNAAVLQDGEPIPLADAMYQLGRHYANVGALGSAKNKELFVRAERLYSASLEAYRARYGDSHEKTKFAQEGLISVQQATGGKRPTAIAKAPPAPAPVAAAPAAAPAVAASAQAPIAAASATATVSEAPAPAPAVTFPSRPAVKAAETKPAAAVTKAPEPRPAPAATARARSEPLREPVATAPDIQPERRPPPPRRAPPRPVAADAPSNEAVVEAPVVVAPPRQRAPRVAPAEPRYEPQYEPAPAPSTSTAGGPAADTGAGTAEGSAGTN